MSGDFEAPWSGVGTGGSRSLDFANTLDWRLRAEPVELLGTPEDLARWMREAELVPAAGARVLRDWSRGHPREAAAVLACAIGVREAIAAIFAAVVAGGPVPRRALARLERACHRAWSARILRGGEGTVGWDWRTGEPRLERAAWAAALDAAELLTSGARARVRQCADAQCGWFFLDRSRNRSRRWCSMKGCGNRSKVRGFQARAAARAGR